MICTILPASAAYGQGSPDAAAIREKAAEVLSSDLYDFGDRYRLELGLWKYIEPIVRPILDAIRYLIELLAGLPSGASNVLVVLLVIVLVALIAHLSWSIYKSVQRPTRAPVELVEEEPLGVDELVRRSRELAQAGNYVDASRALYEAALTMLEEKRRGRVRRGLTTNEYLRTFRSDWVVENLRVFVDLINWKWYRARSFDEGDYEQCVAAFDELRTRLAEESG